MYISSITFRNNKCLSQIKKAATIEIDINDRDEDEEVEWGK